MDRNRSKEDTPNFGLSLIISNQHHHLENLKNWNKRNFFICFDFECVNIRPIWLPQVVRVPQVGSPCSRGKKCSISVHRLP